MLVRNISATGAKLTGDELFCLPEEFELQIADRQGAALTRRVKRVWGRSDAIGVEFLEPQRPVPAKAGEPTAASSRSLSNLQAG